MKMREFSSEEDKSDDNEDPDIAKIKKVQSFFRGWLCRWETILVFCVSNNEQHFRRRWKQIVENYIKSPHAESMRKRNWWDEEHEKINDSKHLVLN